MLFSILKRSCPHAFGRAWKILHLDLDIPGTTSCAPGKTAGDRPGERLCKGFVSWGFGFVSLAPKDYVQLLHCTGLY